MIRSRKDDGVTQQQQQAEADSLLQPSPRRPLASHINTSSSVSAVSSSLLSVVAAATATTTTMAPKLGNSVGGTLPSNSSSAMGSSSNNSNSGSSSSSGANVSAFVASALSASTSSIQLYQNFKQLQRRKQRGPSSSSSHRDGKGPTGIWTVQIPKRMMVSTLGVFLIFPLLIFVWKETHLKPAAATATTTETNQLRSMHTPHGDKRYNPLASWVTDHLPVDAAATAGTNETMEDGIEGAGAADGDSGTVGAIYLPEPIPKRKRIRNERNATLVPDNEDGESGAGDEGDADQNKAR